MYGSHDDADMRALVDSVKNEVAIKTLDWEPIIPFDKPVVPEFPATALPLMLGDFVLNLARATQTPTDLAAAMVMAALSITVQRKFVVAIQPGWHEHLVLQNIVALGPGNRKSAVVRDVSAPLTDYEKEQAVQQAATIVENKDELATIEAEVEALRRKIVKTSDSIEKGCLKDEMKRLRERQAEYETTTPRILVDDVTPEELTSLMAENHSRMGILSAEGGFFSNITGRYNKGVANIDVVLRGHTGEDVRVNRRGRSEFLRTATLAMGMAVQPCVLNGLARQQELRGKGLLARFGYVLPVSLVGRRNGETEPVPENLQASYNYLIRRLLDYPVTDAPQAVTLDLPARSRLLQYQASLEPHLDEQMGKYGHMVDWAAKLTGSIARHAGILHIAMNPDSPLASKVDDTTMVRAIAIGDYMLAHASAAFGLMGDEELVHKARYLWGVIKKKGWTSFAARELMAWTKHSFRTMRDLHPPLQLLTEHHYLRKIRPKSSGCKGRPPGYIFCVNPTASQLVN
jgi:hypothetical protein